MTKFVVDSEGSTAVIDYQIVPHLEDRYAVASNGVTTFSTVTTARFIETTR